MAQIFRQIVLRRRKKPETFLCFDLLSKQNSIFTRDRELCSKFLVFL